jgi:single-stranded DNA-binding protein
MNHCTLMAKIITAPQLRYTQDNQTAIAEMMVAFPGLRADDPAQTLKVIGWGNLAQDIQANYPEGSNVLLEGRLSMNTVDRPEGFKEKQAELTVQRIVNLGNLQELYNLQVTAPVGGSTVATSTNYEPSPTPMENPPVTQPEVDYDDIPF